VEVTSNRSNIMTIVDGVCVCNLCGKSLPAGETAARDERHLCSLCRSLVYQAAEDLRRHEPRATMLRLRGSKTVAGAVWHEGLDRLAHPISHGMQFALGFWVVSVTLGLLLWVVLGILGMAIIHGG
jgi:hypothetical protein